MPTHSVSTFAIRTSRHTNQKLQKSFRFSRQKNYFLKSLLKFLKPLTQNRQENDSETHDSQRLGNTDDRTPACNSGFAKAGVQYFGWQFFRIIEVWFFKWTVVLKCPAFAKQQTELILLRKFIEGACLAGRQACVFLICIACIIMVN